MQLYAWTGQPTAALRQYQECTRLLQAELDAPPAAETTTLYQQIRSKQIAPRADKGKVIRPPIPTLREESITPRSNLPKPATPFVGREAEMAAIIDQLCDPACRLVTLVGQGKAVWARHGWRWKPHIASLKPQPWPLLASTLWP